jgi:hypothetical protein
MAKQKKAEKQKASQNHRVAIDIHQEKHRYHRAPVITDRNGNIIGKAHKPNNDDM